MHLISIFDLLSTAAYHSFPWEWRQLITKGLRFMMDHVTVWEPFDVMIFCALLDHGWKQHYNQSGLVPQHCIILERRRIIKECVMTALWMWDEYANMWCMWDECVINVRRMYDKCNMNLLWICDECVMNMRRKHDECVINMQRMCDECLLNVILCSQFRFSF